jgi:hypothetical protein
VIARLAPGVSREQAETYLRGVYETLFNEAAGRITRDVARYKARFPVSLFPAGYASSAQSAVTRELTRTLQLLMAMVALVLFIAAGNVTNLLVARGPPGPGHGRFAWPSAAAAGACCANGSSSLVLALVAGIAGLFVTVWVMPPAARIAVRRSRRWSGSNA